jgi:general secretion pathway protein M
MLEQLIARWKDLDSRERIALSSAGVVVAGAVLFLAVVDPVLTARASLRNDVRALSEDVAWMREAAPRIGVTRSGTDPSGGGGETVLSAVDASAQRVGLRGAVRRLQPEGSDGVRITLDDASFDAVVVMLGDLRDRGVQIERLTLRRDGGAAGLVDGSLSLRSTH